MAIGDKAGWTKEAKVESIPCGWCKKTMGTKEGFSETVETIPSHGICDACVNKEITDNYPPEDFDMRKKEFETFLIREKEREEASAMQRSKTSPMVAQ